MQGWLTTTIEVLGLEAEVSVRENGNTLAFHNQIRRRWSYYWSSRSTLKSIEKLMNEYSSKEGYEWAYALHVDGGEKRETT